jgi:tetratricopeptide (TPR) repeat protein
MALLLAVAWLLGGCAGMPDAATASADAETANARQVPARARTLYEQATAAMAAGDFVDAQLRFGEFLLQYPDYPGAHVNMAIIQSRQGADAEVEASIDAALALDADYAPALNQLGMLRRRQGRFNDAEAAYLQAVAAAPGYALAHYNLGVLHELYLQRLETALQHFESYQALSGEDEQVTKWIADLKRRLGSNQRTANVTE